VLQAFGARFTTSVPRQETPVSAMPTPRTSPSDDRSIETLRESEERYRLLLDATAEGIYTVDLDGCITWCNPACLRMLGYDNDAELLGRAAHALLHHSRHDGSACNADTCPLAHAHRSGRATYLTDDVFWRRDGTSFPVEYGSYPLSRDGRLLGGVVTFFDATERQQAERLLDASDRRFQATFEHAGIGMALVDMTGHPIKANAALRAMLGYSEAELEEMPFSDFTHEADRERNLTYFRELVEGTRDTYQLEKTYLKKDGSELPALLTVSLVRDARSEPQYAISMVEDISERRRLEAQLRQAAKMEAIGRLAGGVAHDFNNLLTAIMGFGDLALANLDPQSPARADLELALEAADRAATLTSQLLAFGRKQILQPRILDLNTVVTRMEPLLRQATGEHVRLITALAPQLGRVSADAGQMDQILLNLTVNARDAMPSGGTLTIATGDIDLDAGYVAAHPGATAGPHVVLSVSDTGTGMDEKVRAHLFEPFYTTKAPGMGTGLGLATVYGIVKQSGGSIWADSAPGKGTTFTIYLPRITGHGAVVTAERPQLTASVAGSETILLAEDQPEVRAVVQDALRRRGYRVLTAGSGEEALAAAREQNRSIDLLLTDVVMPGMGGLQLAQFFLQEHPRARVLYMSGYSDSAVLRHRVGHSSAAFLQKPFTPQDLLRRVRATLDSGPD
jgi:PAS domain S-box-containing protein